MASIQSNIRVDCWSNTYATIYLIPGKLQEQRMKAFFVISFVGRHRIAGLPDKTFSLVEDFVNARNPQHALCDRNHRPVEFMFTIENRTSLTHFNLISYNSIFFVSKDSLGRNCLPTTIWHETALFVVFSDGWNGRIWTIKKIQNKIIQKFIGSFLTTSKRLSFSSAVILHQSIFHMSETIDKENSGSTVRKRHQ